MNSRNGELGIPSLNDRIPQRVNEKFEQFAGKKMRARVFRDGQELPWILHDEHYDFDYQQSRVLREFILRPGDHIIIGMNRSLNRQRKTLRRELLPRSRLLRRE